MTTFAEIRSPSFRDDTAAPASAPSPDTVVRRLLASGRVVVGGGVLLLMLLACVGSLPFTLSPRGALYYDGADSAAVRMPPRVSRVSRWFGTDPQGRSQLGRSLLGGVLSLAIGICAAGISIFLGVAVGLFAGYRGGWLDSLLMRAVDILYGLPYILLIILLKIALEPALGRLFTSKSAASLVVLFLAIGLVSWLTMARVVRGQVLSLRSQPFIEACRAGGLTERRIFFRHLLPNLIGPVSVYATLTVPQAILQESFLSFLGIGIVPPMPTWGSLASEGLLPSLNPVQGYWWLLLFPCTLLAVTLLSLNFLGDGLRDVFDPKRDAAGTLVTVWGIEDRMENRFGVKDFFLFVLIFALVVSVWVAMRQYDRQWSVLQTIQRQGDDQTRDLAAIRRVLEKGVKFAGAGPAGVRPAESTATPSTEPAALDPFARIKAAEAQPDYAQGDWLVEVFPVNVGKITPFISTDLYSDDLQTFVLETLATRDPRTLEWVPLLAGDWDVSKDGLTIQFRLRRDVTFSDGVALTADDVLFSYQLIMNPKIDAPRLRAYYDKIATVEKSGDYEVTFKFKEPYFESFGLASSLQILPKHFYEKYTPEQMNQETGLLMGSGPYRMADPTSWKPGQQIYLVRNDRYWGEPGSFNRLVFREVNNEAARLTLFRNGETDLFGAQPKQYKELLKDKALADRSQHFEYQSPISGYNYIAWNEKKGNADTRFADRRVRLAMTLLTDRKRICDEVLLGYATIATGPFSPISPQNDPSVKPWPYDPEKAKALLKEAGYADDGSGVLRNASGDPFQFKLTYPTGSETTDRIVKFAKDSYAKAGIVMDMEPLDWSVFDEHLKNRNFDAISLGWGGTIESDIYQEFDSSQIKDQGDNFMSYSSPELDALIHKARSTVDEKQRMPIWHQCQRVLHEDQPYTFLTNRKTLSFVDGRIHNVHVLKIGLGPAVWLEWYVPRALQKYHD